MRLPALVLVALLTGSLAAPARAQERLVYDPPVDVPVTLLSGVYLTALVLGQGRLLAVTDPATPPPPTGIDGWARFSLNEDVASASDWVLAGSLGAAAALNVWDGVRAGDPWSRGLLYLEGIAVIGAVTETVKWAVRRPRPYTYDSRLGTPDDDTSFFSGHTSFTAMAAFHTARAYDLTHALGPWQRTAVYGGAGALALGMGTLRVVAGKHYPSDVLVGAVVGGSVGWLVAELHREERVVVAMAPWGDGWAITAVGSF